MRRRRRSDAKDRASRRDGEAEGGGGEGRAADTRRERGETGRNIQERSSVSVGRHRSDTDRNRQSDQNGERHSKTHQDTHSGAADHTHIWAARVTGKTHSSSTQKQPCEHIHTNEHGRQGAKNAGKKFKGSRFHRLKRHQNKWHVALRRSQQHTLGQTTQNFYIWVHDTFSFCTRPPANNIMT